MTEIGSIDWATFEAEWPGIGNSGIINTGFWNSGTANTSIGATGNTGATISGFGNTGTFVSGFFNTASGHSAEAMSGFFNTASGGTTINGQTSGFFNHGVPRVNDPALAGEVSGLLNTGSVLSGLFSLSSLFAQL